MKKIVDLLDTIEKWIKADSVGNLIIYKPPKVMQFGAYTEQTIKGHELSDDIFRAMSHVIEETGAIRGEFFTKDDGTFDRIKIVKEL